MIRVTKAAILTEQNHPLVIDEVALPELGVGQVLVKINFSGICGKQLEEIDGRRGADPYLPHLLGHEAGGVVEEIGPGVRKVQPGDHVVLHWMKGSGIDSITPTYGRNGVQVNAGCITTFSEYSIISENRMTPIRKDISLDVAALMGCAVTTGLGIVFNDANLRPGQSIAVFGVGGVGLNVVQGAALVNAYPIVAIDLVENKLTWATQQGATETINASEANPHEVLMDLSQGKGFDVTVDTTGNRTVKEAAYNATANTGRTVWAGVSHHADCIAIDSFPLHFGRQVVGSHGGDTSPDVDIPRYLQLYQIGRLQLDELITHRFKLDDINAAIDQVRQGETARCLVEMG